MQKQYFELIGLTSSTQIEFLEIRSSAVGPASKEITFLHSFTQWKLK